jgi:hypothetical protein
MRLVLELWSLLRQGPAHPRSKDEALGGLAFAHESDRELTARDYEFYYWNLAPGARY